MMKELYLSNSLSKTNNFFHINSYFKLIYLNSYFERRKKDLTTGKNHAMFYLLVNIVLGS